MQADYIVQSKRYYLCYIPSQGLAYSTLLLQQTSWFANKVVSSGTCTASRRSTGDCFTCRDSQAPFSNLITRLLIPAALNLHGSLPTFSSLFLLQIKRTDKLSGTRDFIVDGWQAASFPHSTTVPCHNAKSTLNLTDSTKLLEFCSTYKQAACFCLCRC